MTTVYFVQSPRSSPQITWTCDDCGTSAITGGPFGWDGPVGWVEQRTPDDLARDLCKACASVAGERP